MKFENGFDVQAPIDDVFAAMLDVERVAPCVPGAQVLEQVSDDEYRVSIKVKLGPVQMTYEGELAIVERDAANRRAVMRARAKEARGQGKADATVEMRLTGGGAGQTHGDISTEVELSGKAAAMGRGIIQDVSGRLIQQFAANLAQMLEGRPEGQAASSLPASAPARASEPLDAGNLVGAMIAQRLKDPKALVGLGAILALVAFLLGRRSVSRSPLPLDAGAASAPGAHRR